MPSLIDRAIDLFAVFVAFCVSIIEKLGYAGVFAFMAVESSLFVPFPSEVIVPPAGYLTVHGNMNIFIVILCGVLGSLLGASINYFLGHKFGRLFLDKYLLKYSKITRLTPEKVAKMDKFFETHGEMTTFVGRLIPVVRQYISFPAGLSHMNYFKFALYTLLGSGIWVTILAYVGRLVGNNIDLVKESLHKVTIIMVPALIILVSIYIIVHKRRGNAKASNE